MINKLKTYFKSETAGAITLLILIIIVLAVMILSGGASIHETRADEEITFNPKIDIKATFTLWPVWMPNHSLEQNRIMNVAYRVSDGNKDFLYTLRGENGNVDPLRKSNIVGKNGFWDFGLCQLNYRWHKAFIDSEDFKNPDKQVEYCYEVYKKRPTAFYAYYTRRSQAKFFKF